MKGWLSRREGVFFAVRLQRFFYRLQWGFLSQHLTDGSATLVRYFLYDAHLTINRTDLRLTITLGPLGAQFTSHAAGGQQMATRIALHANNTAALEMWYSNMIKVIQRDVRHSYHLDDVIGAGSEATVRLGRDKKHPSRTVAVKCIPLRPEKNHTDESLPARLKRTLTEAQLQHRAKVRGAQVAAIKDVFYDADVAYVILERATGGSLTRLLERTQGNLHEAFVRNVVTQLARTLYQCHDAHIVHRDVKCDNVLMTDVRVDGPPRVLLSDFGFAVAWRPECGKHIGRFCESLRGTPLYLAPEIMLGRAYGAPADMFALGVVAHVCLTGQFPFDEKDKHDLRNGTHSLKAEVRLAKLQKADISDDGKRFCTALLQHHARKRLTAAAVLQHRWIRNGWDVASVPRRKLGVDNVSCQSVFRRSFYAILAVVMLRSVVDSRKKLLN